MWPSSPFSFPHCRLFNLPDLVHIGPDMIAETNRSFLQRVAAALHNTLRNYAAVEVWAFTVATFCLIAIWANQYDWPYLNNFLILYSLVGLGISLATTIMVHERDERQGKVRSASQEALLQLGAWAAGAVVAIPFAWQRIILHEPDFVVDAVLFLSAHLLVGISAYRSGDKWLSFWHFNYRLLFGWVWATILSGILTIGVLVAVQAASWLFGLEVENEVWPTIWVLGLIVFQSLQFLGNLPRSFSQVNSFQELNYPKLLRNLIQYVLLPLVLLYMAILYGYGVKLVLGLETKGYTAYLVSALTVVGVFAYLLAAPLVRSEAESWVRIWDKFYWWALLPLAGLLMWATSIRVGDYGLTQNRVILYYLASWLVLLSTYMITGRRWGLVFVPTSLLVFMALVAFGPLSARDIAVRNQVGRFQDMVTKHNLKPVGLPALPREVTELVLLTNSRKDSAKWDTLGNRYYLDVYDLMKDEALRKKIRNLQLSFDSKTWPKEDRNQLFAATEYIIDHAGRSTLDELFPLPNGPSLFAYRAWTHQVNIHDRLPRQLGFLVYGLGNLSFFNDDDDVEVLPPVCKYNAIDFNIDQPAFKPGKPLSYLSIIEYTTDVATTDTSVAFMVKNTRWVLISDQVNQQLSIFQAGKKHPLASYDQLLALVKQMPDTSHVPLVIPLPASLPAGELHLTALSLRNCCLADTTHWCSMGATGLVGLYAK